MAENVLENVLESPIDIDTCFSEIETLLKHEDLSKAQPEQKQALDLKDQKDPKGQKENVVPNLTQVPVVKPQDVPLSSIMGGVVSKVSALGSDAKTKELTGETIISAVKSIFGELSKTEKFRYLNEEVASVETNIEVGKNIVKIIADVASQLLDVGDDEVEKEMCGKETVKCIGG